MPDAARILIIGGTVFVGRHIVDEALARGHEVTLFHRGRHPTHRPGEVEELIGDREVDLGALRGRTWDVAVDTCGYIPRHVEGSAALLADAVEHYTFVSSASVYADLSKAGLTESDPVHDPPPPEVEDPSGEHYGPLKVACERAAQAAVPGRVLVLRPGLVVGPHDPTDRFTYWVRRMALGGEVLAPDAGAAPVQFVDARDLASWTLDMAEQRRTGTFNVVRRPAELSFDELLECCERVSGTEANVTWVAEDFLLEAGVEPWTELPLWIPPSHEAAGIMCLDEGAARSAGLRTRPLAETVRDTLAWDAAMRADSDRPPGVATLSPERERELLARWHARRERV